MSWHSENRENPHNDRQHLRRAISIVVLIAVFIFVVWIGYELIAHPNVLWRRLRP